MIKYCPQNQHQSNINNEIQTSRTTTTTTTTKKVQQTSFTSTTIDSSSVMELDNGNFTQEEKAKASQKYKSNTTRIPQECTCDGEEFLNQMDPWVLAGIAGGLVLAVAIGVTACCW